MNVREYIRESLRDAIQVLSDNATEGKIQDFIDVGEGWHFGEGVTISGSAIRDAIRIHERLIEFGLYETDAFPGLAGEIRVTAYWQKHYFEFTREPNGRWTYIEEINGVEQDDAERGNLSRLQAEELIPEIAAKIWTTSGIYHENTGICEEAAFKVWHLDLHHPAGFQLWNTSVLQPIDPFAPISGNIIQDLANPQFFGGFPGNYWKDVQFVQHLPIQTTNVIGTSSISMPGKQSVFLKNTVASPLISKSATEIAQEPSQQLTLRLNRFEPAV